MAKTIRPTPRTDEAILAYVARVASDKNYILSYSIKRELGAPCLVVNYWIDSLDEVLYGEDE